MKQLSFEQYWAKTYSSSTVLPAVLNMALREVALNAWNAAARSSADLLDMKSADILLCAGEMTQGELRTTKAVLGGRGAAIKELILSEHEKQSPLGTINWYNQVMNSNESIVLKKVIK
jgi:hypothetical protein